MVIRSTKELEWLLETHFGAPASKDCGLHDKITAARFKGQPLSPSLERSMRRLVTVRNKLVHDRDFNALDDRPAFARDFDEVEQELQTLLRDNKGEGCVIS